MRRELLGWDIASYGISYPDVEVWEQECMKIERLTATQSWFLRPRSGQGRVGVGCRNDRLFLFLSCIVPVSHGFETRKRQAEP
jgi:hypothetical protein